MKKLLSILACFPLFFLSCNSENDLLKEGEMIFLKHKGASMPLLMRGNFSSDVIILMVHGGVGGSSSAHIEDLSSFIEPEYLVAYWDQRHSGASQGKMDESDLTIDQMAEDMQMAIRLLRHKYGADKKIFALCHSWGVILSTYYLLKFENELDGIIQSNGSHNAYLEYEARLDYVNTFGKEMQDKGISLSEKFEVEGESFNNVEEILAWTAANDTIINGKQVNILWDLAGKGIAPYVEETYVQESDVPNRISTQELNFYSPYNPLTDLINNAKIGSILDPEDDPESSVQEFYDFSPMMDKITLPVALYWGRYDHIIGPAVAEAYYELIATPAEDKELIIYERSDHTPMFIENVKFSQDMINFIEKHK